MHLRRPHPADEAIAFVGVEPFVPGNCETWLNVMNIEIEDGQSERKL
ncbi:hypothetical protein [Paracoccus sp. IB05]